ncbi:C-type mannose receptor 2-like [Stigmatopora nigra]
MRRMTATFYLLLISELCSLKTAFSEFHFISEKKTYEEAKDYCQTIHTDLATINNMTEMNDLTAFVPNSTIRSWIGLELGNVSRWHWAWSTQNLDFLNWRVGEPKDLGEDSCAAIDPQGEWFESECDTERSFVCQGNSDVPNDYIFVADTKSWRDAQKHCRDLALDLVSVGSAEENKEVRNLSTDQNVWIGLFRDAWKWSDGSQSSFRYWKPQQPNYGNQHCVAAVFKDDGKWNNLNCGSQHSFICQGPSKVSSNTSTTATTPSNNTTNTGDVSASTTQGETFNTTQFSNVTPTGSDFPLTSGNLTLIRENMTWIESLNYCRERHMDLVYVAGQSTQDRVAHMAQHATSSHIWLGLRYTCNFDLWFWSASSTDCYQNWSPGQGPGEHSNECGITGAMVATGGHKWVGLPETQRLNFICQEDCSRI